MPTNQPEPQPSAAEIAQLQRRIKQYENQPDDIGALRQALIRAKSLLLEQDEALAQLTNAATVTGVVLKVWATPFTHNDLKRGVVVRLTEPALAMEAGELGVIEQELHQGMVRIDFDLIGSTGLRIAPRNGYDPSKQRELELVDTEKDSAVLSNYEERGARVRLLAGPGRGRIGRITSRAIDPDGEVTVEFSPSIEGRSYYYVGVPQLLEPVVWSYGRALVAVDGKTLEVEVPKDTAVEPGDLARLHSETMQIVGVIKASIPGAIVTVVRIIDDTFVVVTSTSETMLVLNTRKKIGKLEEGDRVVLDASGQLIMRNLGSVTAGFRITSDINVKWEDIAGLEEPIKLLHEAIILPHSNPGLYRFYNKKPIAGVLIYGAPGNGKTLLGKASVTAVREIYEGEQAEDAFIYVKGPEILQMMVGRSEEIVRELFARGKRHKARHGYPAVLFIDEAEAILARRGTGISSDVNNSIVPAFLVEMDGMEESGVIVMLATNRPDILDPAITRDKRIDRKIYVPRPTHELAPTYFQIYLRDIPLCNGYTRDELAQLGADELFASKRVLYGIRLADGSQHLFTLGHLASGAMIANVIDHATSIAMRRDEQSGRMEGMRRDDIIAAVDTLQEENRNLDHSDAIREFLAGHPHPIADLQPHHFVQAQAA